MINTWSIIYYLRDQILFDSRFSRLAQMVEATRNNFSDAPTLLKSIMDIPKYGDNDPTADEMVRKLAEDFAQSVIRYSDDHVSFAPSFHTLNVHVGAGTLYGASLDGRLAGQPIAKNVGTVPGKNRKGHTALMRSATAIDQSAFFGGQALDISVTVDSLKTQTERQAFQSLLQTYFRLGGLQVQVNSVGAEVLRKAMAEPANHQNVIVRIAGYSARFVTLDRLVQEEMIERFSHGV